VHQDTQNYPSDRHTGISMRSVLMRVPKPKANTLNICCDVFVRNCQFVITFNACITVVMNSLTLCCVSQGSVMIFVRGGG